MVVIGIMGTIGAGKDVVSRYLKEKYGFKVFRMGDLAREIARSRNLPGSRKVLQNIYVEMNKKHGEECFINMMVEKVKASGEEKVIIDGIRAPWDVSVPRKVFGDEFVLVNVDASAEVRFKRLKKRRRVGFSKTLEAFRKEEEREYSIFRTNAIFREADYTIDNSSTLEDLYSGIDSFLSRAGLK